MLNIQKATPKPTEWLTMQVTDLALLAEFDQQFPGKIKEKDGTWFTLGDWIAIEWSDWLVWDDNEPVNVYTNENFHQYMTLTK